MDNKQLELFESTFTEILRIIGYEEEEAKRFLLDLMAVVEQKTLNAAFDTINRERLERGESELSSPKTDNPAAEVANILGNQRYSELYIGELRAMIEGYLSTVLPKLDIKDRDRVEMLLKKLSESQN